jgi:hypothetical protein
MFTSKKYIKLIIDSTIDLVEHTGREMSLLKEALLNLGIVVEELKDVVSIQEKRINLLEKENGWQDKEAEILVRKIEELEKNERNNKL